VIVEMDKSLQKRGEVLRIHVVIGPHRKMDWKIKKRKKKKKRKEMHKKNKLR
jgi:hypothetical protein